jgi:hypothetical protein
LALVALPIYGAMLAITYDVGFFYGIGLSYFTLFSLAEHVLFAFEVLPMAFVASLMDPSGILSYQAGYRHAEKATPPIPDEPMDVDTMTKLRGKIEANHTRAQRWLLGASILLVVMGILGATLAHAYFFAGTMIAIGFGGLAHYFTPLEMSGGLYFVGWYTFVFLVMSFFLGFQGARRDVDAKVPSHIVTLANPSGERFKAC